MSDDHQTDDADRRAVKKAVLAMLPVVERLTYILPPGDDVTAYRVALDEARRELGI